jgi:hypothetical protein
MISAVLVLGLAACSAATQNGSVDPQVASSQSSDVISQAELESAGVTDAFQAINRLRPMFLRRLRETSQVVPGRSLLEVYLDDLKLGGLETLQTMPIESIKSIRYLTSSEATIRWGTNHTGGVILLTTK